MSMFANITDIDPSIEGIQQLSVAQKFRFALTLQVINTQDNSIQAFTQMPPDEQNRTLLEALLRYRAAQGTPAQQPVAPPPPPPQQPQAPAAVPRQPAPMSVPPPAMMAPAHPIGAPTPMPAPQTHQAPNPMAHQPLQMPMAQPMAQPAAVPRTPESSMARPAMPAPQAAPVPQAPALELDITTVLLAKISTLQKTVDEEVPGTGDLEELADKVGEVEVMCTGIIKTQQVIATMLMLLLENQFGTPRESICKMVSGLMAGDDVIKQLFEEVNNPGAATSGKS